MVALSCLRLPTHPHPTPSIRPPTPPPIDSIRHITGAEKLSEKPAAFKLVASRISHEIIVPHEKYSALNIEIQIAWRWSVFPKMVTVLLDVAMLILDYFSVRSSKSFQNPRGPLSIRIPSAAIESANREVCATLNKEHTHVLCTLIFVRSQTKSQQSTSQSHGQATTSLRCSQLNQSKF